MAEEQRLKLFTESEKRGMRLFQIEVPANIRKILMDLAVFHDMNHIEYLKGIVYQNVERELSKGGSLDPGVAAFLKKKHKYTPRLWQDKEEESMEKEVPA